MVFLAPHFLATGSSREQENHLLSFQPGPQSPCAPLLWGPKVPESSHLEHFEVGQPIRPVLAAIFLHMFDPLDVWLSITVYFAHKFHVAANHGGSICWQASLEDGPVGRTL